MATGWFKPSTESCIDDEGINVPLLQPTDYIKPAPIQLLPEQQDSVQELIKLSKEMIITLQIHGELGIPESFEYWKDNEEHFVSKSTIVRYLKACKWDVIEAKHRLESTLKWRREFRPHIATEKVLEKGRDGTVYINGFDRQGQPNIYMHVKRSISNDFESGLRWSIYVLEKAIELLPSGVEKVNYIINYEGQKFSNRTPMSTTKQWIDILSSHYPERLANGFHVSPSWYFWVLIKVITPFLEPETRSKMRVAYPNKDQKKNGDLKEQDIVEIVDPNYLEDSCGGNFRFRFDADIYFELFQSDLNKPQFIN